MSHTSTIQILKLETKQSKKLNPETGKPFESLEARVALLDDDGIPVQIVADGRATPTDADPIQISRAGVAAALVSIPLRYMHTPVEIIAVKDLDATVDLLAAAIAAMKPGQSWIPF